MGMLRKVQFKYSTLGFHREVHFSNNGLGKKFGSLIFSEKNLA